MAEMGWGLTSEPWGVRALAIIDYWSRGPKATFIFFVPPPHLAHFKRDRDRVSPKKRMSKKKLP